MTLRGLLRLAAVGSVAAVVAGGCRRGGEAEARPPEASAAPAAPTPEASPLASSSAVCEHIIALLEVESELQDNAMATCVEDFDAERAIRDDGEWGAFTTCVLESERPEAVAGCYRIHNHPEQRVCEHVVDLIVADVEASGQDVVLDADARAREVAHCAEKLLGDRGAVSGPVFRRLVECMLTAEDTGQLEVCALGLHGATNPPV